MGPNIDKLIEKENIKKLVKALKNKDEGIRDKAANFLEEIKDPRVVEPLIKALKDEREFVRENAVRILGKMKT